MRLVGNGLGDVAKKIVTGRKVVQSASKSEMQIINTEESQEKLLLKEQIVSEEARPIATTIGDATEENVDTPQLGSKVDYENEDRDEPQTNSQHDTLNPNEKSKSASDAAALGEAACNNFQSGSYVLE